MKKILALALAAVMVLAVCSAAFADATVLSEKAIVINTDKTGHTYKAYQIFTGVQSTDGTKLSNIEWGNGISEAGKTALYTKYSLTGTNQTARKVAEAMGTDAAAAQALAEAIGTANYQNGQALTAISGDGVTTTAAGGSAVTTTAGYYIAGLAAGYYIIRDEANDTVNSATNDFYSNFVVELLDNVVATPKGSTTTVEKKVKDTNDSAATTHTANSEDYDNSDAQLLKDHADYDIGDHVPFVLTATLADSVSLYNSYTFIFTDTLSKGLTYDGDTSWSMSFGSETFNHSNLTKTIEGCTVTVTDTALANATGATGAYEDGHVKAWTVTITPPAGQKVPTAFNGTQAVINYTATLNTDAVIGTAGNPNKVDLTYSNNPNGSGTGKTTTDEVTVFTFQLIVNKVDGSNKPLAGAKFKVEKKNASGTYEAYANGAEAEALPVYTKTTDSDIADGKTYYTESGGVYTAVSSPEKSNLGSYYEITSYTVNFKGLDAGSYQIIESVTPNGYNTIAPITFDVTASDDSIVSVTNVAGGGTVAVTNSTLGAVGTTVVNQNGTALPSTGGIGTTIFYVAGAILVLGAGAILIARRKADAE